MRNTLITRIVVVGLLAAVWTTAPAQITKQGGGYLLRMKYTKGVVAKYSMTTTSGATSVVPAMNMVMPMETKVLSVTNGVGEVQYVIGPISNNGQAMGQRQTVVAKIDSRGKTLSSGGMAQQINNLTLPATAVRPGATWTGVQSTQSAMGAINLNATYKFVGVKLVGGRSVAQILVTVQGGNKMIATKGTGSVFLLVSDGSLHSTNLDQNMTLSDGQGGKPIQMKLKVAISRK